MNDKIITLLCVLLSVVIIAVGVSSLFIAEKLSDDRSGKTESHSLSVSAGMPVTEEAAEITNMYPWYLLDNSAEKVQFVYSDESDELYNIAEAISNSFLSDSCIVNIEDAQVYVCKDMLFVYDCTVVYADNVTVNLALAFDDEHGLVSFVFSNDESDYISAPEKVYDKFENKSEDSEKIYQLLLEILEESMYVEYYDYNVRTEDNYSQYVGEYDITVDFMAEYCKYLGRVYGNIEDAYTVANVLSSGEHVNFYSDEMIYSVYRLGEIELRLFYSLKLNCISGMSISYAYRTIH